jgi:hypothetical protein
VITSANDLTTFGVARCVTRSLENDTRESGVILLDLVVDDRKVDRAAVGRTSAPSKAGCPERRRSHRSRAGF